MFAYAGDLPEISALDNYAPSTITRVYASGGELVGEFAVQRRLIVGYEDIAPQLRQAIIAAEDGDFNTHFGLSISHIIAAVSRDILRAAADVAAGRKTSRPAGASTLTQQLARNAVPAGRRLQHRRPQPRAEDQGSHRRGSNRKALHQGRDPDLLRQPHAPRPRHVRSRGGCAHVLRQVGQGRVARRGRDARRHLPVARPAEPVCQRGRRNGPQKLRAAADGRRGVHHTGRGGHGQEAAHRRQGATAAGQVERPVFPRRGAPAPRAGVRREGAVRRRAVGHLHARRRAAERREPRGRPRRARRGQASRLSPADAERAGGGPSDRRVQGRALVAAHRGRRHRARHRGEPREPRPRQRRAAAHRSLHRGSRAFGLCVDPAAGGLQPVQDGRPHRSPGAGPGLVECHRVGLPRAATDPRGRARGHRQPDRPDQGHGGWPRLRPQQVQSRRPGVPAARVDVQAGRVHSRDRSRVHAGLGHRRRARRLSLRQRRAVQPAELRPQVRRSGHVAALARAVAQHSGDQGHGRDRPEERRRLRASASVSARSSRRTCPSRSALATARFSR